MNKLVKLEIPELEDIEKSKAKQIRATFQPMADMLERFEEDYNLIIQEADKEVTEDLTLHARQLRLSIAKVRIETEKMRKFQKEDYLRAGRAIDGVSNILKWAVIDKEKKLSEIENYFELQEKRRIEELQKKRAAELEKYVDVLGQNVNLSNMEEDVWLAYLETKKRKYYERIEEEKRIERERIIRQNEEAEIRKSIEAENERLREEAREHERLLKKEEEKRFKKERELKEKEQNLLNKQKELKREYEEKLKEKERAKEQAINEKKISVKKLETLVQNKAKKENIIDEFRRDADKVKALISDLEVLKGKYVFRQRKNKKMYREVGFLLDKIINHIKNV